MRSLAVALALVLAACGTAPVVVEPTAAPTHEPGALNVTALLDLSGQRAPSGAPQRDALQLWLDQQQARGGETQRVRVKFVDVAGSGAKLLLELRRAAVDDRADAVVIGVPVDYNEAFGLALDAARLPVLLTLPAPEPMDSPGGRWAFSFAPTIADLARAAIGAAADQGAVAPTLLVSDESAPAIAERAELGKELERRGLVRPTVVTVTEQNAAQRIRPGIQVARSSFFAGASAPYVSALRSLPATAAMARVYLSYLTETSDASALGDGATRVTWPGSRALAMLLAAPPSAARAGFVQPFTDRHGPPSTLAASAYDTLTMLSLAAATAPITRDGLRNRIEALSFNGAAARYDFTPSRHAGFALEGLGYLRWSAQKATPVLAL